MKVIFRRENWWGNDMQLWQERNWRLLGARYGISFLAKSVNISGRPLSLLYIYCLWKCWIGTFLLEDSLRGELGTYWYFDRLREKDGISTIVETLIPGKIWRYQWPFTLPSRDYQLKEYVRVENLARVWYAKTGEKNKERYERICDVRRNYEMKMYKEIRISVIARILR